MSDMSKRDILDSVYDIIESGDVNSSIINTDFKTIKKTKRNVFNKLLYIDDPDDIKKLEKKLMNYRFIDKIDDLTYGSYIRWIKFDDPENKLKVGGYVCDIIIKPSGVIILCKNRTMQMFQLNMSNCAIFQVLSEQENIVLSAIEYIINK
jgi:hypothetical protein